MHDLMKLLETRMVRILPQRQMLEEEPLPPNDLSKVEAYLARVIGPSIVAQATPRFAETPINKDWAVTLDHFTHEEGLTQTDPRQ